MEREFRRLGRLLAIEDWPETAKREFRLALRYAIAMPMLVALTFVLSSQPRFPRVPSELQSGFF